MKMTKMRKKRSKLEIYLEILRMINEGEKKPTRIMYRTNISWFRCCQFLKSMVSQNLIKEASQNKRKEYAITEKGQKVLKYEERMTKLIKVENETLKAK